MTLSRDQIRRAAREALGHRTLLPGQAEAIRAIVDGRDTLALLPTGGGKSAIYQLAGLERPGPTVVVSPLIALQADQVASLEVVGLPGAALNSTMRDQDRAEALRAIGAAELEFLLLAPEQLADPAVCDVLRRAGTSLLVVDEAHCVSEWGHDFRPEYRRLRAAADAMGRPPILALTATASPAVRAEIVELLGLHDPVVIARSFDRPNIELAVSRHAGTASKREALGAWVAAAAAPGIVYAATRRGAEEIARLLVAKALEAEAYHAGLGAKRRAGIQERFMSGTLPIVVATIAFGMGVDKPDVRFVAHADISDTIEAYHQEIGRAGRDGEPALARLFHDPADLGLRRFQGVPPPLKDAQVRAAIRAIRNGARTRETIAAGARLSGRRAELIIGRLEARGAIDIAPSGAIEVRDSVEDGSLVGEVVADQERLRTHATTRVELLRGYAESEGCRRRFLLNALGEEYEPPCGHCDNCRSGAAARSAADADANVAFALEDRVSHAGFGLGTVSRVEGDRVTVRFDTAGYRTISLRQATEGGVLQRAE